MAQDFSKAFYKSKEWRNFRQVILTERGPRCEKCGKIIANAYDKDTNQYKTKLIQLHHIEELTPLNINDASIMYKCYAKNVIMFFITVGKVEE